MTCTSCGSDVSGKKFCPQCGTPVQPAVTAAVMTACPRCGGEVKAGAAFCMHCGSALQAAQPVAVVQPTTRPCPTCHQAVPFENAFCIHCGQNMNAPVTAPQPAAPALVICNNCGKQNTSDMKFCGGCGSPLPAQQGQMSQQPPYGQPQYPQQYGQQQYPQQPQYNQLQYPQQYGQYNQQGYQQQPMMGQQPMTLRCPVCMAMSPLGTPSCPGCRTSLVGVVPTPVNMAPQGQQGMMGGGIGNFLQGNNGKMAMGALGGAAAVLGGEMLLHGVENSMGGGDRDYDGYEHHRRREEEGPLGGLGDIANDIGLF